MQTLLLTCCLRKKTDNEGTEGIVTYGFDMEKWKNLGINLDDYLAGPEGILWDKYDVETWFCLDIIEEGYVGEDKTNQITGWIEVPPPISEPAPAPVDNTLLIEMLPIIRNMTRRFKNGDDLFQIGVLKCLETSIPLAAAGQPLVVPKAWMIRVVKNAIIDELRREGDFVPWGETDEEFHNATLPDFVNTIMPKETKEKLAIVIAREFNTDEIAIIRGRLRNQNDEEISNGLGITQQAVNIKRRKIAIRLRDLLG